MAKKDKKSKKDNKKVKNKGKGKGKVDSSNSTFGSQNVKERKGGFPTFAPRTYKFKVSSFLYKETKKGFPMLVIQYKCTEKEHKKVTYTEWVSIWLDKDTGKVSDQSIGQIMNRLKQCLGLNDKKLSNIPYHPEDLQNTIVPYFEKVVAKKTAIGNTVFAKVTLRENSDGVKENSIEALVSEEDYEEALEQEELEADEDDE